MTVVRPADSADAARWLLRAEVDWWDLVRYGPPGFEVYVRIPFNRHPEGAVEATEEDAVARCLACEVDEEIEFTVGCSVEAFDVLASALPGAVRRVGYGEPAPLYRDPA